VRAAAGRRTAELPPGTPTVTDVVNLGFQQVF